MDNVATVDSVGDFSLQKTIANVEQRLDAADLRNSDDDDDIMPAVANEMGVGQYHDVMMIDGDSFCD